MRVSIDPVPLVLGIYAHVGKLLARAEQRREDGDPHVLGRRFARGQQQTADREVQKMIRTLQTDVKTADKLLKKTADVWKISRETDLVNLVVHARGEGEDPRSYVLLKADEVRDLLETIHEAARGAGEEEETLAELREGREGIQARPRDYLTFGFDPWE